MCDCYGAKCEECDEVLPVHLGDYDTDRDEVKVFCKDHIPDMDCRVFTTIEDDCDDECGTGLKKGWKMAIRYLTDNARMNKNKNSPNVGVDFYIEDR